ncbi:MAG: phosphatidate cytidylyltransferase [Pseudomonadota bacterium]
MADGPHAGRYSDLAERTTFGALFACAGLAAVWFGGWANVGFAMAAGGVMAWEWRRIAVGDAFPVVAGFQIVGVAGAALLTFFDDFSSALLFLMAFAVAGALADILRRKSPWWSFCGAVYIGLALMFFEALREAPGQGLLSLLWLICIVVATDVGAYFAGRLIGGPKLWPAVSPGKTWSGAIGGAACGVLAAWGFGGLAGSTFAPGALALALLVSIVSQGGDLAESAYKRRFGVKDSGRILPGHGGLLDRMDGLIAATLVVGALAQLRPETPVWAW